MDRDDLWKIGIIDGKAIPPSEKHKDGIMYCTCDFKTVDLEAVFLVTKTNKIWSLYKKYTENELQRIREFQAAESAERAGAA